MAVHWTDYPERVETFADLLSVLETLEREDREDGFTGTSFENESDTSAYTVDPLPTGCRFNPRLDRMPGLERLLDRFDIDSGSLTPSTVRDLRRRAAKALHRDTSSLSAMSFTAIADALDAAERPPAPVGASNPAAQTTTFGDFLADVRNIELAAASARAIADSMNGEPGTAHFRMQAAVFEATAAYREHPSFPHLEAHVNRLYGPFTYDNLLRVRGEVCAIRHCGTTDVDRLTVEDVVTALEDPSPFFPDSSPTMTHSRQVNTRPDSMEPTEQRLAAAMRALPSALNNAPQPRQVRAPVGCRGAEYAVLRQSLERAGHHCDAAEWAIHRHVEERRLEVVPGVTAPPGVLGDDGGWLLRPVTNHTYNRERCILWATPALWSWERQVETQTESPRPNQPSAIMSTDLPSPFTLPEPVWTLGEEGIPDLKGLPEVWTLGAFLRQLRVFAGRYANPHEFVEPPYGGVVFSGSLAHAALLLAYRRALRAAPGFDELQTQILLRHKSEVTISSVNCLIRDVICAAGGSLTVAQVEELEIRDALRRLHAAGDGSGSKGTEGKVQTPKKRGGRPPIDPVFDNRAWEAWNTGQYPDYAALAKELNCKKKAVEKAIDRMRKKKTPG